MKKISVGVYDDVAAISKDWANQLRDILKGGEDFEVVSIENDEFKRAIENLEARKKDARAKKRPVGENPFDKYDLIVIDYDLIEAEHSGWLTGEEVAYLARCYSHCGLIVALNQFGNNPFDLTLKGHLESWADLNIGEDQLHNVGLWKDTWPLGFRPWSWPLLPRFVSDFNRRVGEVAGALDKPILETLGFNAETMQLIPRTTASFIETPDNKKINDITFRSFVESSGDGLRIKDRVIGDDYIARIAAARIGKWLDKWILSAQDILVDAPHLVSRMPSVLGETRDQSEAWNNTTKIVEPEKLGFKHSALSKYRFQKAYWLSRPCWWYRGLAEDSTIEEVNDPWGHPPLTYVFCEDTSSFLPMDAAREFVVDLPTQFNIRWCVNPESDKAPAWSSELKRVQYRPAMRFSL